MKKTLSLLLLPLLLVACDFQSTMQNGVNSALEDTGIQVDLNSGKVTLGSSSSSSETSSSSSAEDTSVSVLPTDWPAELALYTDATVTESLSQTKNGVTTLYVDFTSSDNPQVIRDFYRGVVSVAGYSISSVSAEDNLYGLEASKDSQVFSLTAEQKDSLTHVSLTLRLAK